MCPDFYSEETPCSLILVSDHLPYKATTKAKLRRRSTDVPNLTDELSTAKERRFGTAVLVWCGKSVKFDRVCRTFVELNLGSTHGTPSESDVAPVSLQSRTYSVRFGT